MSIEIPEVGGRQALPVTIACKLLNIELESLDGRRLGRAFTEKDRNALQQKLKKEGIDETVKPERVVPLQYFRELEQRYGDRKYDSAIAPSYSDITSGEQKSESSSETTYFDSEKENSDAAYSKGENIATFVEREPDNDSKPDFSHNQGENGTAIAENYSDRGEIQKAYKELLDRKQAAQKELEDMEEKIERIKIQIFAMEKFYGEYLRVTQ